MHKSLECWQRFECSCSANSSHISNCDRFCTAFMMKSIFYNKEAVRIWKCEGKTIKGLIRMFCYVELIIFLNKKSSISQCINVLLRLGEKFRRLNASQRFWLPASALLQRVAGKHCIVGDAASSDTLILNDSLHQTEIMRKKVQHQQAFENPSQYFFMH